VADRLSACHPKACIGTDSSAGIPSPQRRRRFPLWTASLVPLVSPRPDPTCTSPSCSPLRLLRDAIGSRIHCSPLISSLLSLVRRGGILTGFYEKKLYSLCGPPCTRPLHRLLAASSNNGCRATWRWATGCCRTRLHWRLDPKSLAIYVVCSMIYK
jgi:hypothetical protein